jgi:hypothetical protein
VAKVDREDADAGDVREQAQLGERAQDREHRDCERQQGGHHAGEGEDQQHQCDRHGDALRECEIFTDLPADVGAASPADPDRDGRVVDVGVVAQHGRGVRGSLHVVAYHAGKDQRGRAVAGAQARRVRGPVGDHATQARVAGQPPGQGLTARRGGGSVDVPVAGVQQEHHVRLATEPLVQQHLGLARRRGRVVEPTAEQATEHAHAQHGRDGQRGQAQREHQAGAGHDEQT